MRWGGQWVHSRRILHVSDGGCSALVVGTDDWATDQAAGALRRGGITVLQCHASGDRVFPCNAFIKGRVCPLDEGFDVVVTARARPSRAIEPGEVGVICALRTGHPLVVAGVTADNPFSELATTEVAEGGDAVKACYEAAGARAAAEAHSLIDLRPVPR